MKPNEKLIKELCFYLGELDYIIDNSTDYIEKTEAESKRKAIHELLNLPYKEKHNRINYKSYNNLIQRCNRLNSRGVIE